MGQYRKSAQQEDAFNRWTKNRFFTHYIYDLYLVGKTMVDFLFVIIKLFRYLLRLRRYKRKSVEVGVFQMGWVILSANFRRKGASPTNHCWCQKTRAITLSCGIKMPAVHCLVLSQRMHVTDGRIDRRTELRLPRPR